MKVQYSVEFGELRVRDDSGRTVYLHDAFWEIKTSPERDKYDFYRAIHPGAPFTEIPDRLFEGLYNGIRRYHQEGRVGGALGGYEKPDVVSLRKHIATLEENLVKILRADGQASLDDYDWHKRLIEFRKSAA